MELRPPLLGTLHLAPLRPFLPLVPLFVRRLTKSILLTATVLIVTLFPLLGRAPNASLLPPHGQRRCDLRRKNPTSISPCSLFLGDEAVDTLSWVPQRFPGLGLRLGPKQRPGTPRVESADVPTRHGLQSSLTPTLAAPQPVQLRSGWDDMLDVKTNRRGRGFLPHPYRKSVVSSSADSSEYTPSPSPSPSPVPVQPRARRARRQRTMRSACSTLTYLASPVAQALGLPSPVSSSPISTSPTLGASQVIPLPFPPPPPPMHAPPKPPGVSFPFPSPPSPSPSSPSSSPSPSPATPRLSPHTHTHKPKQPIPEDTASTISEIWDAPWPLPPASPVSPITRVSSPFRSSTVRVSSTRRQAASRPESPTLSDGPRVPPGVPLFPGSAGPRRAQSVPRKPVSSRREALGRGYANREGADVIYMTSTRTVAV
ncbi:hypothetical protein B0H13DRAFT_2376730 [Mycena leptocephala]|nr:hypothetical protein B0H13DRAFT_2376730 [Mycena leptocephala]